MTGRMWHTVVIGVGNPYRRDDGVGPAVISRLRDVVPQGVRLEESDGEPSRLLELWSGAYLAIVVDGVRTSGGRAGQVHLRQLDGAVSAATPASSHGVDLGDAVALAQAVDRMPATLMMYGVEVVDTSYGPGLTPVVESAAAAVAAEILTRLVHEGARDVPA
jgi:hydrogenase maturation protease